jgi:hypothetical protein
VDILDVSPTRLNTNAGDIGQSVTGRMLSVACTPDGKELYVGSYANIWTSQDGGKRWTQLTWPQPDPTQYSVPGALGGWLRRRPRRRAWLARRKAPPPPRPTDARRPCGHCRVRRVRHR